MFNNAGGKLQNLAIITMGIGVMGSVIGGIVVWYNSWDLGFLYFLLIAGVGSLSSYISSLFIYAFGELVENVASIEDDMGYFRTNGIKGLETEISAAEVETPKAKTENKTVTAAPEVTPKTRVIDEIIVTQKDLADATSMICPVCKSKQLANRKVCWQCGVKFVKETAE